VAHETGVVAILLCQTGVLAVVLCHEASILVKGGTGASTCEYYGRHEVRKGGFVHKRQWGPVLDGGWPVTVVGGADGALNLPEIGRIRGFRVDLVTAVRAAVGLLKPLLDAVISKDMLALRQTQGGLEDALWGRLAKLVVADDTGYRRQSVSMKSKPKMVTRQQLTSLVFG
jgi:hypothetical protein